MQSAFLAQLMSGMPVCGCPGSQKQKTNSQCLHLNQVLHLQLAACRMAQSILELQKNAVQLDCSAAWNSHCSALDCFVVHAPRLRMLNLGDGGDQNLSTASTWKVLVYDKFCQDMV